MAAKQGIRTTLAPEKVSKKPSRTPSIDIESISIAKARTCGVVNPTNPRIQPIYSRTEIDHFTDAGKMVGCKDQGILPGVILRAAAIQKPTETTETPATVGIPSPQQAPGRLFATKGVKITPHSGNRAS